MLLSLNQTVLQSDYWLELFLYGDFKDKQESPGGPLLKVTPKGATKVCMLHVHMLYIQYVFFYFELKITALQASEMARTQNSFLGEVLCEL